MSDYVRDQAAWVRPPRVGQVVVINVTSTSTGYDLSQVLWNGANLRNVGDRNHFYVDLVAETHDVYFAFDPAPPGTNTIDDTRITTTTGSGATLAPVLETGPTTAAVVGGRASYITYASAVSPGHLIAGAQAQGFYLDRQQDLTLIVKCASGQAGVLRIYPSSQGQPSR